MPEINTPFDQEAHALLSQMTLDEKIYQMSGDQPLITGLLEMAIAYNFRPIPAGRNQRLDIDPLLFSDGPRGVVVYHSTCFPVSMGRGATWDVDLETRIGDAIGKEVRAQGANFFAGVCINILRHPAWGRAQETYGEDSYHLGEMGASLVRGVQRHAMACVKHFACNSIENSRFTVDVKISERTLHEVYLPHFKRCVDEGVASVMSAYNKVNGAYCAHNVILLRDILKEKWGFEGFVISDFIFGLRHTVQGAKAGLDVEMPFTRMYGTHLKRAIKYGDIKPDIIDDAVLRILRQKRRFRATTSQEAYSKEWIVSAEHVALAREAAQKSIVLLKNEISANTQRPLLPLNKQQKVVLIGKLAREKNVGDKGSSAVRPPYVVTPDEGISQVASVTFDDGKRIEQAVALAQQGDVVVLVVGYSHHEEGEYLFFRGGDRDSLALSPHDEALIEAVSNANPHTVVVLIGGSAIVCSRWIDTVPAVVMAWYGGMEGGNGLADILFGTANPSGKLPCVFPASSNQLPFFDKNAETMEYGYYHGYRLLEKNGEEPLYHFGHGLSYSRFEYHELAVSDTVGLHDTITIQVRVTNASDVRGDEIVQLYVGYQGSRVDRPIKELKGFQKITLSAHETISVSFQLKPSQLAYYDEHVHDWVNEAIVYDVYVGGTSDTKALLHATIKVLE